MGIRQLGDEAERVGVLPDWLDKAELIRRILEAQHLTCEEEGTHGNS
jgi:hypothetical protein